MIIGITERDAPASCIGILVPPLDWKYFNAGVRSCLDVSLIKRNGSMKLFQMLMNEKSTTVAIAGPERGMNTFLTIRLCDAPSIFAASTRDSGDRPEELIENNQIEYFCNLWEDDGKRCIQNMKLLEI